MAGGPGQPGPGEILGAGSAAELDATTIAEEEMFGYLESINHFGTDATAALDYINTPGVLGGPDWSVLENLTFAAFGLVLAQAIGTGTILPSDTIKALAWVMQLHRVTTFTYKFINDGLLLAGLALWGFEHGRITGGTPPPILGGPTDYQNILDFHADPGQVIAIKPPLSITLGGVAVPLPDTAGGQVVVRAQAPIKPVKITNTGLSAQSAKAVSLAIAQAYRDHLHVLVNSVDHIERQIAGIERQMAGDRTIVRNVHHAVTASIDNLKGEVTGIDKELAALDNISTRIQSEVDGLQTQIDAIDGQITALDKLVTTPTTAGTTLTQTQIDEINSIPGLKTQIDSTTGTADQALTGEIVDAAALTAIGAFAATVTIEDLAACCDANSAVTNPIRNGGATPGLLSSLGALLSKGFELFLLAASIDAILALFDLPDVILATMYDADVIQGQVEKVTAVMLKDFSWVESLRGKTLVRG